MRMHKGMSFCLLILVMVLASCTTSQERAPDVSESVEPTAGQEATEAVVLPADDELFTLNSPAQGQIYAQAYNLCMEADSAEAGAALYLKSCSDLPLQRFDLMDNGQIQVQEAASEALCVAVAAEEGEPTGGPSHLRRDLMLQPCLQVEVALSQWITPGADQLLSAPLPTATSVAQAADAAESEPEVITLPAGESIKYARYLYQERVSYGVLRDEATLWRVEGDIFGEHTVLAETVPLSEVQLLPPVQPGNILAVGLNYASHAGTAGAAAPEMIPKLPNALAGPNDPIWMFPDASNLHYEAELVVVIGKEGRNVPLESAADYVFGVTAGNDVSERNWQARALQWIRAKSSDSFAPIGPYIVTGLDYNDLLVQSRVNGELRQSESSAFMIHNVEALVSYISQYITLKPGDVIFTGTPGSTQAMQVGDVVEIEVQGVGVLRNTITTRE